MEMVSLNCYTIFHPHLWLSEQHVQRSPMNPGKPVSHTSSVTNGFEKGPSPTLAVCDANSAAALAVEQRTLPARLMTRHSLAVFLPMFLFVAPFLAAQQKSASVAGAKAVPEARLSLREGWELQTSAKVEAKGELISTPAFSPKGWHT